MTSLAARTRNAVRDEPFLHDALRAGVLNYTAAARALDVDGDPDAIATALRRYAGELPEYEAGGGDVRVSMRSGVGPVDDGGLLSVGESRFGDASEGMTAIVGRGDVDARTLRRVLGRLEVAEVPVAAAGVGADALVAVVDRQRGADAVRAVEDAVSGGLAD